MKRFTRDHEWVDLDGTVATVGISDYAQEQLGKISFVEVPEAGRHVEAGKEAAVIESAKAASEIYAPLTGEVVEGNAALADTPGLVNSDAEGKGWLFRMKVADPADVEKLLDRAGYDAYTSGLKK